MCSPRWQVKHDSLDGVIYRLITLVIHNRILASDLHVAEETKQKTSHALRLNRYFFWLQQMCISWNSHTHSLTAQMKLLIFCYILRFTIQLNTFSTVTWWILTHLLTHYIKSLFKDVLIAYPWLHISQNFDAPPNFQSKVLCSLSWLIALQGPFIEMHRCRPQPHCSCSASP